MKGIVIHPLRLKALSEGRLSVLRVPVTKQTSRVTSCPWEYLGWKMVWIDPGLGDGPYLKVSAKDGETVHRVYPRMGDGDYFVKEKLFAECYASKSWNYVTYADGEEVEAEIPADWCPPINAVRTHRESGDNIPQGGFDWYTATVASMFMPEWAARYVLTLGDPVPGKLGEVTENDAVLEGFGVLNTRPDYIYSPWDSNPLDEFGETWGKMYPKHADPGTWTWAYPATWRKKTC